MTRLKPKDVATFRREQLQKQGGICPLCLEVIEPGDAVLDHCHKTGLCRGVLHRFCNTMLGKVENARVRYRLTDDRILGNLLSNLIPYSSRTLDVYHPTHRTEDEKRIRRNAKAKKRRQTLKSKPGDTP